MVIRLFELLHIFFGRKAGVDARLETAIENIVDSIDAKLRLVPAYKEKLSEAVAASLEHINDLVDQVPGPIDFSRARYVSDPEVRAYFASADAMRDIFCTSNELQAFFKDSHHADIDTCYALLCSNKEEKTVTGSALVDDVVRHDILQTTINFFDYKVLSPASSNYAVRKSIKQCIFDGLITYALQHIASIKIERRDLHDQQRILHARLRARQALGGGLSSMLAEGHVSDRRSAELENQYREAGARLDKMLEKRDVLSFYIDEIRQILSKPEDFIHLNVACFRLSDMRIMVDKASSQVANTVCFSELEIAKVMKRVVAVVSYSRNEMKYECQDVNYPGTTGS